MPHSKSHSANSSKPLSGSSHSSHSAFKELPIVDISLLFSDDIEDRKKAAKVLDRATREAGFLYLKGHRIDPAVIEQLKQETKRYFAQDREAKMANYIGHSKNHSGYVPQGEEQFYSSSPEHKSKDLKEAYDIGPESSSLMAKVFPSSKNQWPANGSLKKAANAYYDAMLNLSKILFSGFALALGIPEDSFTQHLTVPPSQLRLIHYFDNPNAKQTDSGIGAHTDYEFFTILLPTSPGLQAMNGAGEWIDIPVLDDCFVINIGDMMEVVSCGEYVATSHRVRQVKQERYAFPFFASLDYDTLVKPLAAIENMQYSRKKGAASPPTAEPVICGDHLLAQTIQTFSYLQKWLEAGIISLPDSAKSLSSFGHIAKHDNESPGTAQ